MKNTLYIFALLFSIALQAQTTPEKVVGVTIDGQFLEFVTGSSTGIDSTFVNTQIANASVNITPIKPTANITLTTLNLYKETVNNTATDLIYTIPVNMPVGSFFVCRQGSTGTVSVDVAEGVTTNSTRTTNARGQSLVYSHQGNDFWLVDESVGVVYTPVVPIVSLDTNPNAANPVNYANSIGAWVTASGATTTAITSDAPIGNTGSIRVFRSTPSDYHGATRIITGLNNVQHTVTFQYKVINSIDYRFATKSGGVGAYTTNVVSTTNTSEWQTYTGTFTPANGQIEFRHFINYEETGQSVSEVLFSDFKYFEN